MIWNNDSGNPDDTDNASAGSSGPWEKEPSTAKGRKTPQDNSEEKEKNPPNPWASRGERRGERANSSQGNQPQGGNMVDDLIDIIQDKVRNILSGEGNSSSKGGFGGFKGGLPKGSWGIGALLVLGCFVLWLGTGLFRVQEGELGVVLRFGEMVRISSPGLQYHLPAPFESVIVQKVAALNIIDGGLKMDKNGDSADATLILTGDANMVHTNYTVQWKIKDVRDYLFTTRNPDATIRAAAESVVREVIGQTSARLALTEGRGQIEIRAQEILQKLLDQYKMGIQIVSIQLQNVSPPHQVVDAFNDLQASLVDADRSRNEAEAYRNDIIPRAEGQAAQIANEATAYSQRIIAEAQGEAGRFNQVLIAYKAHPSITLKRYYLETMQTVLSKTSKIILDEKAAKGILPYLPLNELKGKNPEPSTIRGASK